MSLPRLPYLQNAISGYYKIEPNSRNYTDWMRDQGVKIPIGIGFTNIDDVVIEFDSEEQEMWFALRWS